MTTPDAFSPERTDESVPYEVSKKDSLLGMINRHLSTIESSAQLASKHYASGDLWAGNLEIGNINNHLIQLKEFTEAYANLPEESS